MAEGEEVLDHIQGNSRTSMSSRAGTRRSASIIYSVIPEQLTAAALAFDGLRSLQPNAANKLNSALAAAGTTFCSTDFLKAVFFQKYAARWEL